MTTDSDNPTLNNQHPASGIQDPGSRIQIIGIIGQGKMGTSIFYSLLSLPYSLRWIGSPDADIEKLQQSLDKKILRSLKNGVMSQDEYNNLRQRTIISSDLNHVSDCDIVIEAIPEELSIKKQLFAALNRITKSSCILASNSSSINPSQLFSGTDGDDRIIGMHYFFPVQMKEIVELVFTDVTSSEVRENAIYFLLYTNKQILQLDESNSFILNRLFLDFKNETYKIAEQGKVSEEQLDLLIKEHIFSLGVFDFMDGVGIDTMLSSVKNYISHYPHQDYYSGLVNKLQSLVDAGNLGLKSGQGFYRYQDGQKIYPDRDPGSIKQLSSEREREIIEFLRFTYLNTAKRFTMQSGCTIDEMNRAIREYFGLAKGPFE